MKYQNVFEIFIEILNKHAPMKQKYLRANEERFMTKDLRKTFMKRPRHRNKFYVIGQIFPEKNTKSKDIFVLTC